MNHTVKVIIYNSLSLATSCKELTHWKRLWCQEGLRPGGEGDDRGWDGWMASLTRWTWVWVNSGNWWWTGRPGMLWFMGMQRVGHYWAAELNWTLWYGLPYVSLIICKSGLLIFIFAEYTHTMLNKIPLFHQSLGPRVFLSFSLSLSLRLILWSTEARWAHFLARAWKTLARGRPVPMWSSASPVSRALLVFCINQGISASLSLSFTFLSSTPDHQILVH